MPWLGLVSVGISVDIYAMVGEAVCSRVNCRSQCYGQKNNDREKDVAYLQSIAKREF